jgi:hypothetical protein
MDLQLASLILSVVEHFSERAQTVLGMLEGCVKRSMRLASADLQKLGLFAKTTWALTLPISTLGSGLGKNQIYRQPFDYIFIIKIIYLYS